VRDLQGSIDFCHSLWDDTPKPEKLPEDLARYEIILERVKPQLVIETGLHWGWGARWWAERVPQVITVERDAQMIRDYHADHHGFGPPPENVHVLEGDSLRRYDDTLAGRELPGPVLVVLDSDHGTEHVLAEMERYGTLVTDGSYMVVDDGIYHYIPDGPRHVGNFYDGDPVQAVERFLDEHPGWELDCELEDRFDRTMNPSGWLRR
jgi:cephalosporin hydroxylase